MPELPYVSVVIPTYNRPERLRDCITAVSRMRYPHDRFQVVVVDDGSPEPVEPLVSSVETDVRILVVRQVNSGPASARNNGASHADGSLLAFTDDDCAPDEIWLRRLVEHLMQRPDALVGGRTVNALPQNPYSEASQQLVSYLYDYYNRERAEGRFFASNNMAMSADHFRRIGGFDSRLPLAAGEDRDFCDRWLNAGLPIIYIPEAVIRHSHRMSFRSYWRQHFTYGRGATLYHSNRALRRGGGIKPEPLSFYTNLLKYPFSHGRGGRRWRHSALLALSQVANASGFVWELAGERVSRWLGR